MISDTAGSLAHSAVIDVPDLHTAGNNDPMAHLKARLEGLRPLGFVSVNPSELLVIYDGMSSGYCRTVPLITTT
jgi:hypothetical protein